MTAQLKGLPEKLASRVARHLAAAGMLVDEDPETAYQHTLAARARAPRLAVVREAAGEAAYAAGHYSEALAELRAAKRMNGATDYLPIMADCHRALGQPDQALKLAKSPSVVNFAPEAKAEMTIVEAGARRDLGQLDAALRTLELAPLTSKTRASWVVRLRYAYADTLEAAGRETDALAWFHRTHAIDADEITDAAERASSWSAARADRESPRWRVGDARFGAGCSRPARTWGLTLAVSRGSTASSPQERDDDAAFLGCRCQRRRSGARAQRGLGLRGPLRRARRRRRRGSGRRRGGLGDHGVRRRPRRRSAGSARISRPSSWRRWAAARASLVAGVREDGSRDGMATTLSVVVCDGARVLLGHVGDSRAYVLRGGELRQVSRDHTWVQQMRDTGQLAPEDAARHPWRNVVLRSLDGSTGADPHDVDLVELEAREGDRLLLCSDGLTDLVDDGRVAEVLGLEDPQSAAAVLVQSALAAGGRDNVTCVVLDVVDGPLVVGDGRLLGAVREPANIVDPAAVHLA